MLEIAEPAALPVLGCAGTPIVACTPQAAANAVVSLAASRGRRERGSDVHLCNAYTLALADRDPRLRSLLAEAEFNFPDGKSIVWANRLIHRASRPPTERVYGPDLFLKVFDSGQDVGLRHYLLGSTPAVLDKLETELHGRFPRAAVAGKESPPFRALSESEFEAQVARIQSSTADIVWVGLGTPKQDWEAARLSRRIPAVFCAVGAAFEFVAGTKPQAPPWMQRHGVEWLFRLATEPRRLWRRYLFGNARFVAAAVRGAT